MLGILLKGVSKVLLQIVTVTAKKEVVEYVADTAVKAVVKSTKTKADDKFYREYKRIYNQHEYNVGSRLK